MRNNSRLLIALQDLEIMIREMKDKSNARELEDMGFEISGLEELEKARSELAEQVSPSILNRYEKLAKRYKVAILPITGDKCLGCFVKLPTSFFSSSSADMLLTCENCGRLLYIP
ncbi:MAG: C4-type zinc ribbon domain-containing protein [Candidatus Krumholzibacteriota bacterium]|nr:C4-type zinc ribbon domain-containing protein [Candidatus Krumholzibacteriota bacterium]